MSWACRIWAIIGNAMKEHPILFSGGPMVRALLEGRKTQTRRVIKPQPEQCGFGRNCQVRPYCTGTEWPLAYYERRGACWNSSPALKCPYDQPGDRLWVRETWQDCSQESKRMPIAYRASWPDDPPDNGWRPSIYMPRCASRITLEITDVRAQRLQDITVDDCIDEGIEDLFLPELTKQLFKKLWDSINAKRGYGWDKNPWVWAISFKRIK